MAGNRKYYSFTYKALTEGLSLREAEKLNAMIIFPNKIHCIRN